MVVRVAVVGGGITGVVAAALIRQSLPTASISVWEREHYLGGRACSRAAPGDVHSSVDAGAQYISTTPVYARNHAKHYAELLDSGILTPMACRVEGGRHADGTRHFVAPRGMAAVAHHYAGRAACDIRCGVEVTELSLVHATPDGGPLTGGNPGGDTTACYSNSNSDTTFRPRWLVHAITHAASGDCGSGHGNSSGNGISSSSSGKNDGNEHNNNSGDCGVSSGTINDGNTTGDDARGERNNSGIVTEEFDVVLLTMPVPEILQLKGDVQTEISSISGLLESLQHVSYSRRFCLALFYPAAVAATLTLPGCEQPHAAARYYQGAVGGPHHPFCYIAVDRRKRGLDCIVGVDDGNSPHDDGCDSGSGGICERDYGGASPSSGQFEGQGGGQSGGQSGGQRSCRNGGEGAVVAHTSRAFASMRAKAQAEDVKAELLQELHTLAPHWPSPLSASCWEWRYSQVLEGVSPAHHGSVAVAGGSLVLSGDAFTHSNVDGCIAAATSAAQRVVQYCRAAA